MLPGRSETADERACGALYLLDVHGFAEGFEASVQRQTLRHVAQEEAELPQHVLLLLLQAAPLLVGQTAREWHGSDGEDLYRLIG